MHVLRIALNMPQILRYRSPPNPAKVTDSRYETYRKLHGEESWELDALEPTILVDLIERAINMYRDVTLWKEAVQHEERGRKTLDKLMKNFPAVIAHLRTL